MNFQDLAIKRRSIRKYLDKKVEKEVLDKILQTALMSPASKRSNGWEFFIVEDRETLVKMSQCRTMGSKFVADAPCAIVVAANPEASDVWYEDASIAATFIQLQTTDLGLGSCWVQVHNRMKDDNVTAEEYIKEILNIDSKLNILNIITVGYPNEERKPYDLEKLNYEKIHYIG